MKALDHSSALLQYSLVDFNQSTSFSRLNCNGRHNAAFNRGFLRL